MYCCQRCEVLLAVRVAAIARSHRCAQWCWRAVGGPAARCGCMRSANALAGSQRGFCCLWRPAKARSLRAGLLLAAHRKCGPAVAPHKCEPDLVLQAMAPQGLHTHSDSDLRPLSKDDVRPLSKDAIRKAMQSSAVRLWAYSVKASVKHTRTTCARTPQSCDKTRKRHHVKKRILRRCKTSV